MARYPAYTGNEPCREVDPEIFYPSSFNALTNMTRALLNSMCNSCPMREPCLMWALHHEEEGFWGGSNPEERKRMRKRMGIKLKTPALYPIPERKVA